MGIQKKWILKRLHTNLKKKTSNPSIVDYCYQQSLKVINEEMKKKKRDFQRILLPLSLLASWKGAVGVVEILDGNPAGWESLHTGWYYGATKTLLRAAIADRKKDFSILLIDQEPHYFAHAIANKQDAFVTWLGERLISNLNSVNPVFYYSIPLIPFVTSLYGVLVSKQPVFDPKIEQPTGVYLPVFNSWNLSGTEYANAIQTICNYHCEKCFEDAVGYAEFSTAPYDVFPAEILAIQRVRQELGLSTPAIAHPLLESPLATFSVVAEPKIDQIVQDALPVIRDDFPLLGQIL